MCARDTREAPHRSDSDLVQFTEMRRFDFSLICRTGWGGGGEDGFCSQRTKSSGRPRSRRDDTMLGEENGVGVTTQEGRERCAEEAWLCSRLVRQVEREK